MEIEEKLRYAQLIVDIFRSHLETEMSPEMAENETLSEVKYLLSVEAGGVENDVCTHKNVTYFPDGDRCRDCGAEII